MSSEFKITLLKKATDIFDWWVEGFENSPVTNEDIDEISKNIEISRVQIIEKLSIRKQIEEL